MVFGGLLAIYPSGEGVRLGCRVVVASLSADL